MSERHLIRADVCDDRTGSFAGSAPPAQASAIRPDGCMPTKAIALKFSSASTSGGAFLRRNVGIDGAFMIADRRSHHQRRRMIEVVLPRNISSKGRTVNALESWLSQSISSVVLESVLTASREADLTERRSAERHPLFAQVMLVPVDRNETMLSAYSREISVGGIGLLHVMPVEAGAVYEVRTDDSDFRFRQHAEVVWCRSAGHGWYLSGWRFVAPVG